jgi:BMFP domain-containing protein YqiC
MNKPPFPSFPPLPKAFADLQDKVGELMKSSPAAEVEKHMKGALASALNRMDVVTREDFDIQAQMLSRALEKLSVLEKRVAELEAAKKQ